MFSQPLLRWSTPTATEQDQQPVTCAECQETFPSVEAATEHCYATHGKPEDEPTAQPHRPPQGQESSL